MNDVEREAKRAAAEISVGDREFAGRQPRWKCEFERPDLKEIARAGELQGLTDDADPQRHHDAVSNIFLKAGRPAKTFCRMDHLRKAAVARIDACPDLTARSGILGYADDGRKLRIRADRQGSA